MKPTEAVQTLRLVRALCPAQAIDEYTSDAWEMALADVDMREAGEAIKQLSQTHRFIAPADIIAEIKRTQAQRLATAAAIDSEPEWLQAIEDPMEHSRAYIQWRKDRHRALLAGESLPVEPPRQIVTRDLGPLVRQLGASKGGTRSDLTIHPEQTEESA